MIYAITGKTGSGKTFLMVKTVYKMWKKGANIYSNTFLCFPFQFDNAGYTIEQRPDAFNFWERFKWQLYQLFFLKLLHRQLEPYNIPRRGKIVYFADINEILHIKNGVILFDEAQVLFNARNWEALPYEFQYKLQQSRKHDLTLICTCQNLGTIDITYRRLVHVWFHCERGFTIGTDPVVWGIFKVHEKDIDMLYNNIDDLKVPILSTSRQYIHKWQTQLYDTFYDIGFTFLKTICLTEWNNETKKLNFKFLIIPKRTSLNDALRSISSLKLQLKPNSSKTYRKY